MTNYWIEATVAIVVAVALQTISRLWSKWTSSRTAVSGPLGQLSTNVSGPPGQFPSVTGQIPTLTKYNFKEWSLRVKTQLMLMGASEAILQPLMDDDWRNLVARVAIFDSVPPSMKGVFGTSDCAYNMMNNLKEKYANPGYLVQAELEKEIVALRLPSRPSLEEVKKHLDVFMEKVDFLRQTGIEVPDQKKRVLLAETLPELKGLGPLTNLWMMTRTNLRTSVMDFSQAVDAVSMAAADSRKLTTEENETKVFAAYGMPRKFATPKKCFRCNSEKHLIANCPLSPLTDKAAVEKSFFNKTNDRTYQGCDARSRVNYFDSAASSHQRNTWRGFENFRKTKVNVTLADGSTCKSQGTGDVLLQTGGEPLELKDAMFTPDLDANLVSVGKLTDDGYKVMFEKDQATVFKDGKVVLKVPRVDRMYQFTEPTEVAFCTKQTVDWHSRFGHPSETKLKQLQRMYPKLKLVHPPHCDTCSMAKQRQAPYKLTSHQVAAPLELIHTDICESQYTGFDGSKYFVLFVDEYTKYTVVANLKNKSAEMVLDVFKQVKARLENQLGKKILKVRSDNGGEFRGVFDQFLLESGIKHELSVPYCHQQNGNAERTIGTLVTKTRSLMYQSCTPPRFWPLAVKAATYLYNLSPHSALDGTSPQKSMFPNELDIIERGHNLHVFGSLAYRYVHKEKRIQQRTPKFEPTSEKWIFAGYALNSDAYLLLNPSTNKVIEERNLKVVDHTFPFCERKDNVNRQQCPCESSSVTTTAPATESLVELFEIVTDATASSSGGEVSQIGREEIDQPTSDGEMTPSEPSKTEEMAKTSVIEETTDSRVSVTPSDDESSEVTDDTNPSDVSDPETMIPETDPTEAEELEKRYPSRIRKPPDFYDPCKPEDKALLTKVPILSSVWIPETYDEAMNSKWSTYWKEAQAEEFTSMLQLQVFDEVIKPPNIKVISCKWVYSIKRNPDGTVDRFKARLVARGFSQRQGFDFWETYSPTVLACSIRTFLTVCKMKGMVIHQVDVKTAFLNGDIDGEIYVNPPAPYNSSGKVWKLKKALYGLKQSPRCWSNKLKEILAEMNFYPTRSDKGVYVRTNGQACSYILVYVDDMLVAAQQAAEVEQIKKSLKERLEIKDMGEIGTFLGVDFQNTVDGKYLTMSQQRYIEELAGRFHLIDANPITKLAPIDTIDLSGGEEDKSLPVRNLVGGLLFIANMTRPDISAAVSYLSRFLDHPTRQVWSYCKQVLRYLHSTKEKKLWLGDLDNTSLVVYADANFAPSGGRKSQSGVVMKLAGSTVGWLSKKQKTVSTSTTEAEYVALSIATNETLWLQHLLFEMLAPVQYPTTIYEDNRPTIAIVTNQTGPKLAKHIDVKYQAIQDYSAKGYISVEHICTKDQLADGLTKVRTCSKDADLLLGAPQSPVQNQGVCYDK